MKIKKLGRNLLNIFLYIKETFRVGILLFEELFRLLISVISDVGGKEDKAREEIMKAAEKGYKEREEKNIKTPTWAKERREKSKQKRRWL